MRTETISVFQSATEKYFCLTSDQTFLVWCLAVNFLSL